VALVTFLFEAKILGRTLDPASGKEGGRERERGRQSDIYTRSIKSYIHEV